MKIKPIDHIEKGATLVEFVIVLPLLLALVLGISEFSFAFARLDSLNKVTQEGARFFSDPTRAHKDSKIALPLDVSNTNPSLTATRNLMAIYDTTALPNFVTANNCADLSQVGVCFRISTTNIDHIEVISVYQHNFIVGNALSAMVSIMTNSNVTFGPSINLSASASLRVQ